MKNKNKFGFTLAEVLITLVIIGIIAAITIPTLINNYKKQEYVTSFKAFYSLFQNGVKTYTAAQGVSSFSQTDLYTYLASGNFGTVTDRTNQFDSFVDSAFKTVKRCPWGYYDCYIEHKTLDKSAVSNGFGGRDSYTIKYYLPNSMMMSFNPIGNCVNRNNRCLDVDVDINGAKGPNLSGRDYFRFALDARGKLIPLSYYNALSTDAEAIANCSESVTASGDSCSLRIIKENWEMNY